MSEPVINVESLSRNFLLGRGKRQSEVAAVKDLSFQVEAGERLAFIGPNGAGKSTSIKMLTGILHPTNGSAEVLGLIPWRQRRHLAARIGTLFGQRSQLWEELAPLDSLKVLAAIFGLDGQQTARRMSEVGELLGAQELFRQPMRTLSLGQRMRCELAACLLHEPELLFLDEPTIGLDLLGKKLFRDLLIRVNSEVGTTVFLTSHDVTDVEQVANRAIVVNHGTIIYDDSVQNMRRNLLATKRVEVGVAHGDQLTNFGDAPGLSMTSLSPTRLQFDVDTTVQPIGDLLDQILRTVPVADLSVTDPPLEQVIAEIYERPA